MKTLQQAIDRISSTAGASLRKHLSAVNINDWEDITRAALYDFRDHLAGTVSPGTARTVMAYAKSLFNRYSEEVALPKDWQKILTGRSERPRRTYLTTEELSRLEKVRIESPMERVVLVESLIEAYTGARVSDVMTFTEENFREAGYLSYTSIKTKVTATIPISEKTKGWIAYAQEHRDDEPTLAGRNKIIRRLAKRAGILTRVKVFRAGKEEEGEKWRFLSSHSFRCSTATNLSLAGASLTEIRLTLGHTSEAMSSRYVVAARPQLSAKAMAYFGV